MLNSIQFLKCASKFYRVLMHCGVFTGTQEKGQVRASGPLASQLENKGLIAHNTIIIRPVMP